MASPYDIQALFRVDNLVAVVTGGGTGIGLVIAKALALNGAKAVYIVGRREDKLKAAAESVPGNIIIPVVGDVSSLDSIKAVADRVRTDYGYVNAVVANAGIGGYFQQKIAMQPGPPEVVPDLPAKELMDGFLESGMQDFTNILHTNTTAPYFTAMAFLDLLVAGNEKGNVTQKSQFVVTTSAASFLRSHPGPGYVASKAAASQICKLLGTILSPYKVRVNNLAPGFFMSEMSEPFAKATMGDVGDATKEGAMASHLVPLGRFGTEAEMAGNILYLLSPAGGYNSGLVLLTDGGATGQLPASY